MLWDHELGHNIAVIVINLVCSLFYGIVEYCYTSREVLSVNCCITYEQFRAQLLCWDSSLGKIFRASRVHWVSNTTEEALYTL